MLVECGRWCEDLTDHEEFFTALEVRSEVINPSKCDSSFLKRNIRYPKRSGFQMNPWHSWDPIIFSE